MTQHTQDISPQLYARGAGLLYLLVIMFGIFSELFVRGELIAPGDAAATAHNIMAAEFLFRLGFVSDLLMSSCFLLLVLVLYHLLKPVHQKAARVMVAFVIVCVPILCLNMLNQFAALRLLSGDEYLTVFDETQRQALVMLFLKLHGTGYMIAQIFFSLWLLPLGFLVYRSGFLPKLLGILLMVACGAMLVEFFSVFLFPQYNSIFLEVLSYETALAEFSICLWLLIRGINIQKWRSNRGTP